MTFGMSRWSISETATRCWWWTRPATSRTPVRGVSAYATAVRHTLIDRELYCHVRFYDWAWITITEPGKALMGSGHCWCSGELAFHRCYSPHRVALPTLVRVLSHRHPACPALFTLARRQHQYRAQQAHYQQQLLHEP